MGKAVSLDSLLSHILLKSFKGPGVFTDMLSIEVRERDTCVHLSDPDPRLMALQGIKFTPGSLCVSQ